MSTKKPKSATPGGVPRASFSAGIVKEIKARFETTRGNLPLWIAHISRGNDDYRVDAVKQDLNVYWRLVLTDNSGHHTVGGGWFKFVSRPHRLLVECRAGILPKHQGRGIYPEVLKALRINYRRPLQSDVRLSAANIKAWAKVGVFDAEGQVYRINPHPLPVQEQIKQAWLNTEGTLPPKEKPRTKGKK